jgi:hypothetical protein
MNWQVAATTVLVTACAGYAAWMVMPAALRRRLATWAGRPLPAASGGCGGGCDGCASTPAGNPAAGCAPGESVIRIVRQAPR